MRRHWRKIAHVLLLTLAVRAGLAVDFAAAQVAAASQNAKPEILQRDGQELLMLANNARAAVGAGPLKWDSALASAALQHCLRMAKEGPIAHRYAGEADLTERAGQAGAHFSTIAENVASGSWPTDPAEFQDGWMHSPGHRANLLNPQVDSVGIAVVASHGVTYAVADYSLAVPYLNQSQVEASFAQMLRAEGLSILRNNSDARAYCTRRNGERSPRFDNRPSYQVVWQNPNLGQLPQELLDQLKSRPYRQAAIASCSPQDLTGQFTVYRVAVLLY